MKLVVGLGNPGARYAWTRHNAGWHVLDLLRQRLGVPKSSLTLDSQAWGPIPVDGERVLLLKPLTYMNLSGSAVVKAFRFFDIGLEDLLVVYDDAALPFGRIRLRARGSAGGHKGMISVIAHLGSLDFPRLRIGIDSSGSQKDLAEYVTEVFSPEELAELPAVVERAADVALIWITRGTDEAMREANSPSLDAPGASKGGYGKKEQPT
ncbi:MAG: aminoacyl-tRNA hydrolase [Thermovirgaceae bacterium]|nr:aminoacyl-tRNA hydrolase [Synergistales bacterium]HPC75783.1 aminoacyl-tRNA hydrolase [Synergistales bacterium]HRS48536.1 aminoacyl-tRNA hydrolase [Thermovirgaceae bacterium]HRU90701.1 aminoacyl-tRNA hydrolase [Thermovirgaceae bacterium]